MNTFNYKKLLRSVLSLVMVLSLLVGCGAMFAGCSEGGSAAGEGDPTEDPGKQYENLTDVEYFQALEKNSMGGLVDAISTVYGNLLKTDVESTYGAEGSMTVQIGDMILDMLEESYATSTGETMDFSFLSKLSMDVDLKVGNKLQQMDMGIGLNGHRIFTASTFMSLVDYTTYVGFPELSNIYGELNIMEMTGGATASTALMNSSYDLLAALPSEEEFSKLLNRYIDVALKNLENVTRETTTLELDGLKQDVNKLTVKIYEKDIYNVAKAVLETAKDDKDLEKAIDKVNTAINKLMKEAAQEAGGSWNEVDLYDMLHGEILDLIDSMDIPEDELDTENYLQMVTYVDASHNIIGRDLSQAIRQLGDIHYYTVTEGKNFAFEAVVEAAGLEITGSGTNKSNVIDAEYTLSVGDADVLVIDVKDWEEGKDSVKGSIKLEPTADLMSMIFGSSSGLPFADVALELKLDCNDTKAKVELNLLGNDALIVGIALDSKTTSGGNIQMPSNTIDFTNQNQLQNWVEGMDFDALLDNLRKAGVPNDFIDALESALYG
ncbi:MAG: hypothetical protein E7439_01080 [Ruminococcaceae bacterium]|nr:hypothetical protein [Oscillospiraceae bacterium]